MLHVVLYQPEIPPNTGNIMRLCHNTGTTLHLIKPLGFVINDHHLKRAGLDYVNWDNIHTHDSYQSWLENVKPHRCYMLSTKATQCYSKAQFEPSDAIVFGPETRGLPQAIRESVPDTQQLTIPMVQDSRSINLSNSVAIVLYEAWRQLGFAS